MPWKNHLRVQLDGTCHRGIKINNFEPQEDSIAVRPVIDITNWTVMVFNGERVQLQNNSLTRQQLFVHRTAVTAVASKQLLIPLTALLYIPHSD